MVKGAVSIDPEYGDILARLHADACRAPSTGGPWDDGRHGPGA